MVNQITRCGLIVTQSARTTALLDEFITLCDWPVFTRPPARSLFQQIELSRPVCLVFWLDPDCDLAPTAQLIARLRDRGPRPYRIAIAHCLDERVEHAFRSAGVHSYVSTSGNLGALVENTLLPFVDRQLASSQSRPAPVNEVPVTIRGPTEVRGSPAIMRPP